MKLKQAFLESYRSDRVLIFEWVLAAVTAIFIILTSAYVDMRSLTIWSTNVWDVTLDSNIRHLYEYTAQNVNQIQHAKMGSELFSVLPWSVWNLPIWAIQRFGGIPIATSPWMLMYSKMFTVVLALVILRYTKKITMLLTNDPVKAQWAMFLSASSSFQLLATCYAGQNDILMMAPSVIGIYHLLRGKEKTFLAWSAVAIAIKPFFAVPFLAVLLLYEKNIFKAALKALISVSGMFVQKLLFMGAPMYKECISDGPSKMMLEQMFPANINTAYGGISFFAIALVLIYFYCYSLDFSHDNIKKGDKYFAEFVIYTVTMTYTANLILSPVTFYRMAVLIPFLYITIVLNSRMRFYNGVIETAMTAGIIAKFAVRYSSSLFRIKTINYAVVQYLFGYRVIDGDEGPYTSIETYVQDNSELLIAFQPVFAGIAVIGAALLLWFNHPDRRHKQTLACGEKNCRVLLWVRAVLLIPFIALTLWMFYKAPIKLY